MISPVRMISSIGNALQKPITLCQFQSRARPFSLRLKSVTARMFGIRQCFGHHR